jgi:polyhydroxyalkanoate synthesis regulator phasin
MAPMQRRGDAAETVRSAVDRTFQATLGQAQVTRERAQELVDEVTHAASRVRDVLDDLRVATGEDVRALRARIEALERRVSELEARKPKPSNARKPKPSNPRKPKPSNPTKP